MNKVKIKAKADNATKKDRWRKGQSLVEALVALSILTTALLGIETLLTRSFLLDRVTADQTKATYLASEGIEITKNLLDHQVYDAIENPGGVAGDPDAGGWNNFCGLSPGITAYYQFDYMTTSCPWSARINLGNAVPLSFDPTNEVFYQPTSKDADATAFTRTIEITEPAASDGNEIDVLSTVTWSTGSVTRQSLTLEDHFYNWNPGN